MIRAIKSTELIHAAINDPQFIARHRKSATAFTRNRKLSFAIVTSTILQLAKRSLQIECNLLGEHRMTEPASKQAFSKARYKLSYTAFRELNDRLIDAAYRDNTAGLWREYRVFGVDGSTIRLPESDENAEYFGRHNSSGFNKGRDPIIARISEVMDLNTGMIVNADIGPMSIGERSLAKEQIESVIAYFHSIKQKIIFVFDRGYISQEWIKFLRSLNVDFIFRVPNKFNNKIDVLRSQGECDAIVDLGNDLNNLRVTIRNLPSGEQCQLLTSLVDQSQVVAEDLMSLYWLRWSGCEEGYKKQKVSLELENFIGIGVEAVLQEFWATVLAINLFQIHCFEEEGGWDIDNPPTERINRNVVFGSLREPLFQTIQGELSATEFWEKFRKVACRSKIKVRPNRHYSRNGLKKEKHVFRRVC